jgi:glycosyltransferase involved in cell wall biosynthesis
MTGCSFHSLPCDSFFVRPRLLVFIVAYKAEKTVQTVLTRIPARLQDLCDVEVLVIDDASTDATFERALKQARTLPFPCHVLVNPDNQGYGGNQKLGYHFAIERGFDYVALVHGDGQYAPECLPELLQPLLAGEADAVFGSRMLTRGAARQGGMPFYKYVGNKILTWFENAMLRTNLSEFHSGYRVYSVSALKTLPWELNTNRFHFDTEIIIQFVRAGLRIRELPIPTYYGDEICSVNGLQYARDVARAVVKARAQELGLFYERRFDCRPVPNAQYQLKTGYRSPHSMSLERVAPGSRVLDLGCAGGYVAALLKEHKGCRVTAVDAVPLETHAAIDKFLLHDLDAGPPRIDFRDFDFVLMLDVIEHLRSPERFVEALRDAMKQAPRIDVLVSTPNVGFLAVRLGLLLGQWNYGKRGILDLTHTRLFTFSSIRRLFEQTGFSVEELDGIPGPFPLALGDGWQSRALLRLNMLLIRISRRLFSYQIWLRVKPLTSLEYLMDAAERASSDRTRSSRVASGAA